MQRLDAALESATDLRIRGGAAVLAHGFEGRATVDIDVLPTCGARARRPASA